MIYTGIDKRYQIVRIDIAGYSKYYAERPLNTPQNISTGIIIDSSMVYEKQGAFLVSDLILTDYDSNIFRNGNIITAVVYVYDYNNPALPPVKTTTYNVNNFEISDTYIRLSLQPDSEKFDRNVRFVGDSGNATAVPFGNYEIDDSNWMEIYEQDDGSFFYAVTFDTTDTIAPISLRQNGVVKPPTAYTIVYDNLTYYSYDITYVYITGLLSGSTVEVIYGGRSNIEESIIDIGKIFNYPISLNSDISEFFKRNLFDDLYYENPFSYVYTDNTLSNESLNLAPFLIDPKYDGGNEGVELFPIPYWKIKDLAIIVQDQIVISKDIQSFNGNIITRISICSENGGLNTGIYCQFEEAENGRIYQKNVVVNWSRGPYQCRSLGKLIVLNMHAGELIRVLHTTTDYDYQIGSVLFHDGKYFLVKGKEVSGGRIAHKCLDVTHLTEIDECTMKLTGFAECSLGLFYNDSGLYNSEITQDGINLIRYLVQNQVKYISFPGNSGLIVTNDSFDNQQYNPHNYESYTFFYRFRVNQGGQDIQTFHILKDQNNDGHTGRLRFVDKSFEFLYFDNLGTTSIQTIPVDTIDDTRINNIAVYLERTSGNNFKCGIYHSLGGNTTLEQVSYGTITSLATVGGNLIFGWSGLTGAGSYYYNGLIEIIYMSYNNRFNANPVSGLTDAITVERPILVW